MKQQFFMLCVLIASIIGVVVTLYYIDINLRKESQKCVITLQPSESVLHIVNECGDTIKTTKSMVKIDTTTLKY